MNTCPKCKGRVFEAPDRGIILDAAPRRTAVQIGTRSEIMLVYVEHFMVCPGNKNEKGSKGPQ